MFKHSMCANLIKQTKYSDPSLGYIPSMYMYNVQSEIYHKTVL